MKFKTFIVFVLFAVAAFGQTATPVGQVTLPSYIMFGGSYNQFTGASAFVSGVVPEVSSVGLYGSATTDLVPVKFVDKATGKVGYLISGSGRLGQHKTVFNDTKSEKDASGNIVKQSGNMLLIGGDFGASFSQSGAPANTGVSIGLAGSFTVTYVRQLSVHWAIGVPIRMLWMSGVGPSGTGAWNPVAEFGLVWKP